MERMLREKICLGDVDGVRHILNLGVDVNAREPGSGWTALHWACKEGYLDIAALLLGNGADQNARTEKGETPVTVCSNKQILFYLSRSDDAEHIEYDTLCRALPPYGSLRNFRDATANSSKVKNDVYDESRLVTSFQDELVLKIRVANTADPDFIEVELPRSKLTYQALFNLCRKELNLNIYKILKLRKLPNTILRKDKDIQRLQNFQEIEVVADATHTYENMKYVNGVANSLPTLPANGYQSISKKDQTILY